FINTRFVNEGEDFIDEPPFIDTDIGRGTILFNREDFEFVLRENDIKQIELTAKTRYVLINFIEVGGDHLDRIINNKDLNKDVQELTSQTKEILRHAHQVMYFINFKELINPQFQRIDYSKFHQISSRVSYLKTEFPLIKSLDFVISRYDEEIANNINQERLIEKIKKEIKTDYNFNQTNSFLEVMHEYLKYFSYNDNWSLNLEVLKGNHLFSDNSLDIKGIMKTFTQLFHKKLFYSEKLSQSQVILHLLKFYKNKTKENVFWVTDKNFEEYIAKLDFKELPESIIYQNFLYIKEILIQNNYCIHLTDKKEPQFKINFQIFDQLENKKENWIIKNQNKIINKDQFRFPNFTPLFDFIYQFIKNNTPVEFWFKNNRFIFSKTAKISSRQIFNKLEEQIVKNLVLFFDGNENLSFLLLLIEDYFLGQNIINYKEITRELQISANLIIPKKLFTEKLNFFEKDYSTNSAEWKVIIPIKLTE
ncbi:MAG: hypothetical protein ACW981_04855, partial [Candidatus Hodarchaeales archaeon]